ncbi:hypothetical protein [uncultured Tolumonas sp.]|uniref:hypothetical protein n=1 Tax=uncultured Tolumonas sp. TaxID=263765 RepID=UPI002A0A4A0F|nr:hypothetical protein [uncultured Tolumonas sp.]
MSDKRTLSGADILRAATAAADAMRYEFKKMADAGYLVTILDYDRAIESLVAVDGSLITTRAFTQEEMRYRTD